MHVEEMAGLELRDVDDGLFEPHDVLATETVIGLELDLFQNIFQRLFRRFNLTRKFLLQHLDPGIFIKFRLILGYEWYSLFQSKQLPAVLVSIVALQRNVLLF